MPAYPSDKKVSHHKFYYHHKPILVPLHVKYIILVPDIVNRGEISLYIRKVPPFCLKNIMIPFFQGNP